MPLVIITMKSVKQMDDMSAIESNGFSNETSYPRRAELETEKATDWSEAADRERC
jgi:hypothetical protein